MIIDSSWRRSGCCRELNFTVLVAQEMLLPMTEPFARERWFSVSTECLGTCQRSREAVNACWVDEWRRAKVISAVEGALGRKENS